MKRFVPTDIRAVDLATLKKVWHDATVTKQGRQSWGGKASQMGPATWGQRESMGEERWLKVELEGWAEPGDRVL